MYAAALPTPMEYQAEKLRSAIRSNMQNNIRIGGQVGRSRAGPPSPTEPYRSLDDESENLGGLEPLSSGVFASPFPFDSHGTLSSPGTRQTEELLCTREVYVFNSREGGHWDEPRLRRRCRPDKNRNCIWNWGPVLRRQEELFSPSPSTFHLSLRFFSLRFSSPSLSLFLTLFSADDPPSSFNVARRRLPRLALRFDLDLEDHLWLCFKWQLS